MINNIHKFFFGVLFICAASMTVDAQSAFNTIIQSAIGLDLELKAQEASIKAGVTFNDVDGPQIDYEHQWPSGGEYPEGKWVLSITQDFDWPGLYRARSRVGTLERDNAALVSLAIRADKALSVKQIIIDIINSHRRHELYSEIARNLARIDSLTRVAYDRGEATALDLWKMSLAVLENNHSIAKTEGDIRALEGALSATGVSFINGEAEFWHDYPLQAMVNPAESESDVLLKALLANSSALGAARLRATKLEAVPGFSVGYLHAYEEATHFNGLRVGIRLPSFSQKKKNRVAKLESEAMDFTATYELDKQKAEMTALYEEACALSKALADYSRLTGDASYLKLLDKSYKAGQLTVIDYLNEINLFTSARIGYLDLEYRYNLVLARLNRYRSLDF